MTYRILTRPDLRPTCFLWPENNFISPADSVPGISTIGIRSIVPKPSQTAKISQIRIHVLPSVEKYEAKLLERIAKVHYDNSPWSLTPDLKGNLPHPNVLERRLHIGIHNTRNFIGPPVVVTLKPRYASEIQEDLLIFRGVVELDNFIENDPQIAVVYVMEYKVSMTVNLPEAKKKKGLAAMIEKISPSDSAVSEPNQPTEKIEKFIVSGWGVWIPTTGMHLALFYANANE